MESYNNLKMTLENNEQAVKAVDIIKEIAAKREPVSPNELNHYVADIQVSGNTVVVDDSCSLWSDTFLELTIDIIKACAVLTHTSFDVHAWYYSCNCGYCSCVDAVRKGDEVEITSIISEEGDGCCPECGEIVVHYDEYDPSETYFCPECGDELNHLDMFNGYLPEVNKEILKISKC